MKNNNQQFDSFILAVGFLTKIPTPIIANPSEKSLVDTPFYYPIVGLIIGIILLIISYFFISFEVFLLSTVIVALWVFITGSLHLDGLADLSDALIGGLGNKEKTRQILKDPHIGVHGVTSIVTVLLIKWASIYTLLQHNQLIALFLSPIMARLFILPLIAKTNYYQTTGIAAQIFTHIDKTKLNRHFYIYLWIMGLFILFFFSNQFITWLFSIVVLTLILLKLRHIAINRLGGMSGDVLGAAIELFEIGFLFSFVFFLN